MLKKVYCKWQKECTAQMLNDEKTQVLMHENISFVFKGTMWFCMWFSKGTSAKKHGKSRNQTSVRITCRIIIIAIRDAA